MYADAGYVTERTLAQADNNAMELLGPTRPDPHKGPYNADAFVVDVENQRAICPQGKTSTQCSHIKDGYMETEYYRLEWGGVIATIVQCRSNARAPRVAAASWWLGYATIWYRSGARK